MFSSNRRASRLRSFAVVAGFVSAALVITACSTNNVLELRPDVDLGIETAAVSVRPVDVAPQPGMQALLPNDPYLAGYSVPADPTDDPYAEPYVEQPAPMSADETACRQELDRLDVTYEELDPINDGGACQIAHPVKISAIGSVKMKPAATLRCDMAATVANWTKNELVPSSRRRYLTGVKTIHQASSYSCRNIARSKTASEHSKGNALDIARIELNSGRDIEIEKPGLFAFRTKGLLNNVRSEACEYFSTVLGPGYNHDHRDHFHFDIKPRRNGRVACH